MKALIKKIFYSITLTYFRSKILIIFNIMMIKKLGNITYQIKSENRFENKKNIRLEDIT